MAYLSPPLSSNRGLKLVDQWNEKYVEKANVYSPGHKTMNTTIPPPPPQNGLLNKPSQRSDQNNISLKSNSFNEKKCQVYVHHFNKIPSKSSNNYIQNNWRSGSEIHQNLYKHESSDFSNTKIRTLKKQFDNLSLQSKKPTISSPYKIPKSYNKHPTQERIEHYNHLGRVPYAKSSLNAKIDKSVLFKPQHKAIIHKLEESYWAKWKPNKHAVSKESHPKMKGLYTENEKIKLHYRNNHKNERRKERGDSNNSLILPEKDETCEDNLTYVENLEQQETLQENEDETADIKEEELVDEAVENEKEVIVLTDTSSIMPNGSDVECNTAGLKHTDSFILTSKKQTEEKPHYQQPKCIKLFKNADYTTTTQINYIKGTRGGSYPLKSCLKKENSPKSNNLGRPGSPVKATSTRRQGRANKFTK